LGVKPRISVLIPTRERCRTLRSTLATVLSEPGDSFEVIVSDNASQDETQHALGSISDSRLRTFRTDKRLSMSDNWDYALENASGDYVLIIGDDDGLAPGGIAELEGNIAAHPRDVYSWNPIVYRWPVRDEPGRIVAWPTAASDRALDLRALVQDVFRAGGTTWQRLPFVYHGLVRHEVLRAIRAKTGRVFHSMTPDLFSGFALPAVAKTASMIGRPVTIHGNSEGLGGWRELINPDTPYYRKAQRFIAEFGDYQLHKELSVLMPLSFNLMQEPALLARDLFSEFYRGMTFCHEAMWGYYTAYTGFESPWGVFRKRHQLRRQARFSYELFLWHYLRTQKERAANRIRSSANMRFSGGNVHGGLSNVFECYGLLAAHGCRRSQKIG
jgi:glycosyltransferase involved in cell wall biosynthesis